jgi:hypothetical protein
MALAAAVRGGKPRRHLEPVGADGEDEGAPVSLADRLAAAQAAMEAPRQRVSELEAALAAAEEAKDYAAAARIQEELPAPREALALAEAEVRIIGEAQAAVNAVADAERQRIAKAREREEAERALALARDAEQRAAGQENAAESVFWGHLAAARGAFQRMGAAGADRTAAMQQQVQIRVLLGEVPAPGPRVPWAGRASALKESSALVRELLRSQL